MATKQPAYFIDDTKMPEAKSAITFGTWDGENIEWRVLDFKGPVSLLLAEHVIDCMPYDEASFDLDNDQWDEVDIDVSWESCSLRSWLNGEFLDKAFSDSERARIAETSVANKGNAKHGTKGGSDTKDQVFCLSIDEARSFFTDDDDRICYPTRRAKENGIWTNDSGACHWWLRSPGYYQSLAADIDGDGGVDDEGAWINVVNFGVRPALWLQLSDSEPDAPCTQNWEQLIIPL